jgi:hypothetical protein
MCEGEDPVLAGAIHGSGRRYLVALVVLWAVLSACRWVAALPIIEPWIFRDELARSSTPRC